MQRMLREFGMRQFGLVSVFLFFTACGTLLAVGRIMPPYILALSVFIVAVLSVLAMVGGSILLMLVYADKAMDYLDSRAMERWQKRYRGGQMSPWGPNGRQNLMEETPLNGRGSVAGSPSIAKGRLLS